MVNLWLHLLGLVLIIVGYFGPWVPHKTVALTVTGYELSEFAKFFPQVQSGAVPIVRALFLTPLVAAAILIGLLGNRPDGRTWNRLLAIGLAGLLLLFVLPPLNYVLAPTYRAQLALVVIGGLLILLTLLTSHLSPRLRGGLSALLTLAGAAPALWQFALLRPLVAELYDTSLGLGWGVLVCLAGFVLILLSGVRSFFARD
jgi:hypothetical protein